MTDGATRDLDGVLIREVAPGDLNAIFSWWLRDLRDADPGPLPDALWYPAHREHIEQILASPRITARVAAAADKPDEILGFAVAEPNEVLWWVHVRRGNLRGHGIAKRLLESVQAGPGVKAAWTTPDGAKRLRNPWRGRQIRRREAQLARSTAEK